MNERTLRIRAFVDSNWGVLLAVFLLLALAGGWFAYGAYVDPPEETTSEVISSWSVDAEWSHSATVTEDNTVFPVGTELEDRTTYFGAIAPTLSGVFEVGYTATEASDVSIDAESTLVARSVDQETETVYWSETDALDTASTDGMDPDGTVETSFSINTTALDERIGQIRDEIGADPGTLELFVETTVTIEGTFDGDREAAELTYELPLELDGTTYSVDDPGPQSEVFERTEPVSEPVEPGVLGGVIAPILLLLGLVGAAGVAAGRHTGRFAVDDAERDWLAFRDDRSEFDEWVTRISLPEEALRRPTARAASLQDLVDFAIDNSAGVVEDPERNAFFVITDEYVYTYEPPAGPDPGRDRDGSDESVLPQDSGGDSTTDDVFESEESVATSASEPEPEDDAPAGDGENGTVSRDGHVPGPADGNGSSGEDGRSDGAS
ncbi:hypothetical protein AArcSl_1121 [Halalkaliarchaeum desulfuricum]|uniref:Rhodanese domain-containing protein n=1 Tax=Halalkaliarchaeum desulfuricum TaxID=2055893 RepID=A0A343TI34_9EURY|nr:DUF5305 domain-containing protein [Halalkaliarchaeum desulfuricum]AUX08756.1 hypothetical protein AArcSl_1121 [Halalkaliarchaeum desulfuricum]